MAGMRLVVAWLAIEWRVVADVGRVAYIILIIFAGTGLDRAIWRFDVRSVRGRILVGFATSLRAVDSVPVMGVARVPSGRDMQLSCKRVGGIGPQRPT